MSTKASGWEIHLVKKPSQEAWWVEVRRNDEHFMQFCPGSGEDGRHAGFAMMDALVRLLPEVEFNDRYEKVLADLMEVESLIAEVEGRFEVAGIPLKSLLEPDTDLQGAFRDAFWLAFNAWAKRWKRRWAPNV